MRYLLGAILLVVVIVVIKKTDFEGIAEEMGSHIHSNYYNPYDR